MKTCFLTKSYVAWVLLLLITSTIFIWLAIQVQVGAQTSCSAPLTFADIGSPNVARWESFQSVSVTFYEGEFTIDERNAIRGVFNEFEDAGRTQNCSNVHFMGFGESVFTKPWGNTNNTYYVSRAIAGYAAAGGYTD